MLLSDAFKTLQREFKGIYCTVTVEAAEHNDGTFKWSLYVGIGGGHIESAPTFQEALRQLRQYLNPKKVKSQDVEVKP